MGKYLVLSELYMSRVPEDPKEQIKFIERLRNMAKEDLKNGKMKDFGLFLGTDDGYQICEGTEEEIFMSLTKYIPYFKFKVHSVISMDELEEISEKWANM